MGDVYLFPKLKRPVINNAETEKDIRELASHYTYQMFEQLGNAGIKVNPNFINDSYFLSEVLVAIMMRNKNLHHSIQDIIDDSYIPEMEGPPDNGPNYA